VTETLDEYNARKNAEALEAWQKRFPMPNVRLMLQGKWLSQAEVPHPIVVTIRAITQDAGKSGRDGPDIKWIMWFQEMRKGLPLNKTVVKTLAAAFGDETDMWIGRKVRMYVDPSVMFAGETVGGIRLQPPKGATPGFQGALPSAGAPAGARFDPMTGKPLPEAAAPGPRFDPMTGKPLDPAAAAASWQAPTGAESFDETTGEIHGQRLTSGGEEFDDDIPF